MSLWIINQLPPLLTKTCATTEWNRPPWDNLHHRIPSRFTVVYYIGISGRSWRYDIRHNYEQHFWVYQQGSISLHHHHNLLSFKEEGFFPHRNGKYKFGLMKHQVILLIFLTSLWMHSHQAVSIEIIHYTRKLYLWPSVQSWHALPYHMKFYRETCRKPLQSS